MIAYVSGILEQKELGYIIIDVQGIGYKVFAPASTLDALPAVKQPVKVYTEQIIREDSNSLYGFIRKEERNLFAALLIVNGVGPKAAMSLLSSLPLDKLVAAVTSGNATLLSSAPGIGSKTAQRIIIELKEKLAKTYGESGASTYGEEKDSMLISDAISALMTLGLNPKEAREAVTKLDTDSLKTTENIIKAALKALS